MFGRYTTGLFSSVNRLRIFRETNGPGTNSLIALTPDSAQCFPNGAVRWIHWNTSLLPGTHARVTLELSVSGGVGWDTIAALIPDNGSYQWTVPAAVNAVYCYIRYTLTDSTGSIIYSSVTSPPFNIGCQTTTHLNESNGDFIVFPNPASASIHISFHEPLNRNVSFFISDITGKRVKEFGLSANDRFFTLDVSNFHNGMYLIQSSGTGGWARFAVVR